MGDPSGFGGGAIADSVLSPRVTIGVVGGTQQECTAHDGATVTANANVYVPEGDALASVEWTLNGAPIGSGEQITQVLALGMNTLSAQLLTRSGAVASASSAVTVRDTQAPLVSAAFIDARTGKPVMHVDSNSYLSIQARATDACDPAPVVQAILGTPVTDGGAVAIQVQRGLVNLPMPQMQLSVTARDASNNAASGGASLTIGE